jgi:hypothetical protein
MARKNVKFRFSPSDHALRTTQHRNRYFFVNEGSRVFVLADDQSTDSLFRASFVIVLQRLHLENRNDYKCFGGLRNVERNMPGDYYQYIHSNIVYNSSVTACCTNYHHSRGAGLFTSVRLNYIIWSKTLWDSK